MLGAGAAMGGLLPMGAHAQAKTLDMWWWGEQELPGLQAFVDGSIAAYKDATVKSMLQDTAVVISQFQTAAAAGNAPDVQYLWNGIYHMESVWLGYLKGLKGLVKDEVITASNPTQLSHFGGDIYRLGWYPLPMFWCYNKVLFEKAGLDPEAPPATWESPARCLRKAQVVRRRGAWRRHSGRLLERMVHQPFPAAESRYARRGRRALHRRQGFPRTEIP